MRNVEVIKPIWHKTDDILWSFWGPGPMGSTSSWDGRSGSHPGQRGSFLLYPFSVYDICFTPLKLIWEAMFHNIVWLHDYLHDAELCHHLTSYRRAGNFLSLDVWWQGFLAGCLENSNYEWSPKYSYGKVIYIWCESSVKLTLKTKNCILNFGLINISTSSLLCSDLFLCFYISLKLALLFFFFL